MPIKYNTDDWFVLNPESYRKVDLCAPNWPVDIDLDFMKVCGAPFGGPLAIFRDPGQIAPGRTNSPLIIKVLNTIGVEIGKISWTRGKLIAVGWSDTEEIICVQEAALVFVYDMFGNEKESYSIGKEANLTKIVDAKIFQSYSGTGVAVFTTNERIFTKMHSTKDRTRQLPEIPKSSMQCSCWEIITEGRNSYCLLGRENEVIKLFPGESVGTITRNLFDKPFKRILLMSVSYNNQNLALYTNNGLLWMGSVDMKTKFCEFNTGRQDIPKQIEWIMSPDNTANAVLISYKSDLLFVHCDNIDYYFDPAILLIPEMDGVRIITNYAHQFIQKVPKCLVNIFGVCSSAPSSFLFEAYKKFQDKSHTSDEYINLIKHEMDKAVDDCIEAVGYEFSTENQKNFLRTICFGKSFIPGHNPDSYIHIMHILRVLNALRDPKIAMPLTYQQFKHLKPDVVLGRLVFRKHYAVAIQIAKHLKLPEAWILEHWAYNQIASNKNDIEVARKITDKFKNPSIKGISFCNIAENAYSIGRNELAIKLLDLEPKSAYKVPLLLKLEKYNRAIQNATESGDTELITQVLLEIKTKMMLTNFHVIVREYPMALNIYKKILNELNSTANYEIYKSEDDHKSFAEYHLVNAINDNNLESMLSTISNSYAQGRKNVETEICSDISKIMKLQKTLTTKYARINVNFNGLSIHDTIYELLQLNELKEAEKIKSDFKVPDKRFWWLRIRSLSEKYKWEELEKFAKSKRSPIGYEPFVEVCLKQNNLTEAKKYILKCRDDRKTIWYMRAKLYDLAAECAVEQGDLNTLYLIKKKTEVESNQKLLDTVNFYLDRAGSRK